MNDLKKDYADLGKEIGKLINLKNEHVKKGCSEFDSANFPRAEKVARIYEKIHGLCGEKVKLYKQIWGEHPSAAETSCWRDEDSKIMTLAEDQPPSQRETEPDVQRPSGDIVPEYAPSTSGCTFAGSGGDCEHTVGLPGVSIPGRHDGPDDTVDVYGKPNGWCWSCWKSHQIDKLRGEVEALQAWQGVAAQSNRDIEAYLKDKFRNTFLKLDSCMPVGNVREVVEYLTGSQKSELSGSEAVYGFCGWLTTQWPATVMSKYDDASPIARLVDTFCKKNNLPEPRDHWERSLEHPEDLIGSEIEIKGIPSDWGVEVTSALKKLSGDMSHNNIAAAKQILKRLLER